MENEIRDHFGYDPATGSITWLVDRCNNARSGSPAGSLNDQGYLILRYRGKHFKGHRVAWLLAYGEWPVDQIDHINGDRADNRLCNLREASHYQNLLNRRRRKSAAPGLKGVSACRRGNYRATICLNGKQRHLGEFRTPEAAHAAYVDAAKKLHGEFASFL